MSPREPDRRAAIIGIGCRLPGGVDGPGRLWEALVKGDPLTGPIPADRWARMVERLHPDQRPERPWTAGVIDGIDAFDRNAFGVNAHEAAEMDPQQRMILEVVSEALADAGIAPGSLSGTRTGVWAGSASVDQQGQAFPDGRRITMSTLSGLAPALLANRVSYLMDLRGPSMAVDTACSASATALHLARQSLELGEADTAVVIGSNTIVMPGPTAGFVDAGVLAPDGVCRPFDEAGDGYVRAEGVVVTVLRRLADAREDRDRVYAVVRGTVANSDGHSPAGLYAPNPPAHDALLRDAYEAAGLDPSSVDYVQCHGTGTKAGDSSEGRALARVLGRGRAEPLPIGSVKGALGHSEGASGLVGVVCAALGIHHATLPPTVAHETIRPALARQPLRVPTEAEPWPETGRPRTAGVSAFGFGGSNVHVVLEQAPDPGPDPAPEAGAGFFLVPVSAATPARLAGTAEAWASLLAEGADAGAVASTAQHRRDHAPVRAAVVASTSEKTADALRALADGTPHPALVGPRAAPARPGPLVWMFAGQGSQHAAMARSSYRELPVFREALEEARDALVAHLGRAVWRPGQEIGGFETAQHAIFLTQVAQAATWRHWGHTPDVVIGHSLGEVAAAHAAGALTLDDATRVVAARSSLLAQTEHLGGLLVTDLTFDAARAAIARRGLEGDLVVAARNAPDTTVVSGFEAPLEELRAALEADGAYVRRVADDVPAHSPAVEPLVPRLGEALVGLAPRATPGTVFCSTARARPVDGDRLDADYWTDQLRAPVRFAEALADAVAPGAVVLEVAGRSTLSRGAHRVLDAGGAADAVVIAAGDTGTDDHAALLTQLAALYTAGHTPARWPEPRRAPVRLPVFWDRGRAHTAVVRPDLAAVLARDPDDSGGVLDALAQLVADTLSTTPDAIDPDLSMGMLGTTSVAVIGLRDAIQAAHPALDSFPVRMLLDLDTSLHQVAATISDRCRTATASAGG
ncbi:type I polyketide synthase [Actinorugispora endophytica]|uniref:Acyl transferase domain-containing protein n=1 Tax=Actinorugispora endophytica TaxID=1605990 RepID=A0A4R6V493_9ACTN|nr:beta-ketoacyl synthase N-terminal-like domain-containing protein [Actinorugispora endophytica]TDQ53029.1 acyl transferase domain-containing protein [Actinorugispora endophytica]